jgi:DNA-binding MarR family transcriptional regulator
MYRSPVLDETSTAVGEELYRLLVSIRRSARRHAGRPVELSGLTGAQFELVRLIRRSPGVSVAEAARELRVAPNTVSTLVRQLSARGLLLRRTDESDRRVAWLDLPPGIRRKVDAWRDRRIVLVGAAVEALTAQDRRRLLRALPVLERLAEALEAGV